MTDIFVSDLFGYNIDNNSSFVIIHSNEIYKLLKKVAKDDKYIIWDYNRNKIDNILRARNVDPEQFKTMGNMLYGGKHKISTIILANKTNCITPNVLLKIGDFPGGSIVDPIFVENGASPSHCSMGLYYVKDGEQLNMNDIYILPKKTFRTVNMDFAGSPKPVKNYLESNPLALLSSYNSPTGIKYEIVAKKSFHDPSHMKISTSGKYVTLMPDKKNIKLKSKQNSEKQTLSYNAQGELIIDDKCLSYSDNNSVYFDNCSDDNNQKWTISDNKISSSVSGKCLETNGEEIYLQNCSDIEWNVEDSDVSTSSDYTWNKHRGKTVVLVKSDNPWYINQDVTEPMKYTNPESLTQNARYRYNADYKSDVTLDPNRPDLGMGYSYLERANSGCEGFGPETNNQDKNIIIIIMSIVFLIVMYRCINC